MEFKRQDLGEFDFFKFDTDGKEIDCKFIGIINDTEKNPNLPEFEGNESCMKYKRNGEICGIVVRGADGRTYILPLLYALLSYFRAELTNKVDFDKCMYKLVRISKGAGKDGFITIDIFKAEIAETTATPVGNFTGSVANDAQTQSESIADKYKSK